jgi:hypothetical protein
VDKDGAFHIAGVPAGHFRVRVDPMPENAYLQSVMVDGAAAPDMVVDLSHGARGVHLKVTVDRNGAEISGALVDKDGEPEANPLAMVFLVQDAKLLLSNGAVVRATGGKFDFKGNRPGKYRIGAIDALQIMSANGGPPDQEILDKLFASGEEIELKPGDRVVKNLKLIDRLPGKEAAHDPKN